MTRHLPCAAGALLTLLCGELGAAAPIFENRTPVGFSPADSTVVQDFVSGSTVSVLVDLNQAATYEYPVIGQFHALERSVQLSPTDTDGMQIDIAMVDVVPFGTSANLPAPGVTEAAGASSPVIHVAWIEQAGLDVGGMSPVYQVLYAHSYDMGASFSDTVSTTGALTYHPLTFQDNGPFASLDLEVDSRGNPRVAYAFISRANQERDQNVYLTYSQDGGEIWKTPIVVNDTLTTGNSQGRRCAFPRMAIDDRDNIFISYLRGTSAGSGTEDVMLAKVNRYSDPFTMVPVGSLGTVGSSGGVRLTIDGERQVGPDLAVGDGDALHLVYFSDPDDEIQHKRGVTDTTWVEVGPDGWEENSAGAVVGSFVDEIANTALEQEAEWYFPTIAVDRRRLPDRVHALYKFGDTGDETVQHNSYDDDGTRGTGATWGGPTAVWSTGGSPLFDDGDQKHNIELNWTITERVAALVDDRLDHRGDLHIAFTGGYSSGGEHDVYYARYNGSSWTLPEKVADDDSDVGTEDGIAAGDTYLLSPAIAHHPDADHLYLAFAGGAGEGLGVKGVTDVDHHPYFKVLGRDVTYEDESVPVGGYQYTLSYIPVNPQTPAAEVANRPVFVHVADPADGSGLGATGSSDDGFLTGNWESIGTSLRDTHKRYEGQIDNTEGSDLEWGDDNDKVGLLVKLDVLAADQGSNLQIVIGGTASSRLVRVAAAPPAALDLGAFFALGADIDIVASNSSPTVAVTDPDGSGDVADVAYTIKYALTDADGNIDVDLDAALYAYPSAGLRTVQDIRIFATLIADQNDRVARNAAGTDDLGDAGTYTWDDPPTGLKTSALFASILRIPSGEYYVYLVADDGVNPPVYAVSPGPVSIIHGPVVQQIDPIAAAETVDTGVRTGVTANPYDLDFSVVDYDSDVRVQLFYSAFAGLASVSASGAYPNQAFALWKSPSGERGEPITSTTSLSRSDHDYSWDVTDPQVDEGDYYLYAVATDSVSVTVGQSAFRLTVRHSPSFTFYEPAKGTQRTMNSGSQPAYTIQWQKGPGDGDLDDDARLSLYYTAVDPVLKDYTGTTAADSAALVNPVDGNATLIAGLLAEDGDREEDMYTWDLRTASSAPPDGGRVWLYAVASDPGGNVAVELGGSLVIHHSPYVLFHSRLPEISQGDAVRLEWDDYMVDDGIGTDDAYLRLYASRRSGLETPAQLEAGLPVPGGGGDTYLINSSDGTASGTITPILESGSNGLTWDTQTSTFSLPEGKYSVYAAISADPTFGDNTAGGVSEAPNLLSVTASYGTTPNVTLSPNRVMASPGDTLTFEVQLQSEGEPASALTLVLDLPPGAFTVVDSAAPFTDLGLVLAGGTVLEDTTIGNQLRFSKSGTPEVVGTAQDPERVVSFRLVTQLHGGLKAIEFSDTETEVSVVGRSLPLRRSTGLSARDATVQHLAGGRIQGVVLLEGRAPPLGNGNHSTLLDVHLRLPGSAFDIDDAAFADANDDNLFTIDTVEVQTGEAGGFTLESLPAGRYVLTVKDTSHLSGRTDTFSIRPGETISLGSGFGFHASDIRGDPSSLLPQSGKLLQAGDVTEDNEIDEDDVNAIDAAWGNDPGRLRFAQADLNNDGRVSVEDLTAAISNISNSTGFGAPPVYKASCPEGSDTPMANHGAVVAMEAPEHQGAWRTGHEIEIVVAVRGLSDLAGYAFDLLYDPAQVEVSAARDDVGLGGIFAANPTGYHSLVRQGRGILSVAAARRGREWSARGDGELLRLRVRLRSDGYPGSLEMGEGVLLTSSYVGTAIRQSGSLGVGILPQEFALAQNYPNPFNPSTTIPFAIPVLDALAERLAVPVRLDIYNALGQKVRTLIDEDRDPGHYQARWDGRDAVGREVGSGVYVYRLRAGDRVRVQKMALAR
ncbi:hypothetical protein ACFL6X_00780 [Candidatus Latescibacterota bacterium]